MVVKAEAIYAIMQPPVPASTGADGQGSSSGVLEAMVKRSAKKSICVMCSGWLDRCDGTVLIIRGSFMLSFYILSPSLGRAM